MISKVGCDLTLVLMVLRITDKKFFSASPLSKGQTETRLRGSVSGSSRLIHNSTRYQIDGSGTSKSASLFRRLGWNKMKI